MSREREENEDKKGKKGQKAIQRPMPSVEAKTSPEQKLYLLVPTEKVKIVIVISKLCV